ncbi:response regulator [Pseudoroseicyclus aestuarii]|uniref:Response regulator receiver protein n=1 Tax=Pseudoroseicyclus aestuarii TaxID=1795041 RepID=A0A318SU31_9RHOB|nr:response regulator [Pseudoroseicyclus aestuarii]PYE84962.1 response regulator receiver protein [Pseudoroseicyclus aestuarii]
MSLKDSLTVMVVDDMSTSRGIVTNCLEEMGVWKIRTENDGKAAFQSLAAQPVHLVLSDLNMPGLDGLGLLKALRENKSTAKIGFILVTGSPNPQLIQKAAALGLNNMIKKPFTTESMKKSIEQVVGRL